MRTDTEERIIKFIENHGKATAKQLYDYLQISPQAAFKQLKKLIENNRLTKQGKPPKVFYHIYVQPPSVHAYRLSSEVTDLLNANFYVVTPSGEERKGVEGFVYWCEKRGLDVQKSAQDYCSILKKSEMHRKDGLIDGLSKMKSTFKSVFLDALYYQDFYALERFGKTRLGQILLYAKQSQDKMQMRRLIDEIKPSIESLMKKYAIDGIGFIPPTVKRQVQLMVEIEHGLNVRVPHISIVKIKTPVIVPQKTLSKLDDRIENAAHTIVVGEMRKFTNVLLVDDAVGSGSTLNETARHLREKGAVEGKIIGLAITGSFKGFDVISEV